LPAIYRKDLNAARSSAASETFFLPATSLIADRKHADQPAAKQPLGVGAVTRVAGRRKLDVESTIVAVGDAAVPTTRGVRFRGVQDFLEVMTMGLSSHHLETSAIPPLP
jgi:hypothetical protein